MSEKDLFESIVDQKKDSTRKALAKDDRGNPANEHAKKLAKDKSSKKIKPVNQDRRYRGHGILPPILGGKL